MEKDQEFITYVVKSLVDNPEAVSVDRKVDDRGVLLTLTVDPSDMGKVIGKQGNTAKALRKLLSLFGAKNEARISLQIAEPEGSVRPERESGVRTVEDVANEDEESEKTTKRAKAVAEEETPIEENPTSVL